MISRKYSKCEFNSHLVCLSLHGALDALAAAEAMLPSSCAAVMRTVGTPSPHARVVNVFGDARPHHPNLFANRRANRMKAAVHAAVGVWLAAPAPGKFAWPRDAAPTISLTRTQLEALVLGLLWKGNQRSRGRIAVGAVRPQNGQMPIYLYPLDAERLVINLEMAYAQWSDARRALNEAWRLSEDERQDLKDRIASADRLIEVRARLYRALRLPSVPDRIARRLRQLDVETRLGTELLVTGSLASVAYDILAGGPLGVAIPETFGGDAGLVSRETSEARTLFLDPPLTFVVATVRRRACPLAVPTPLSMAKFLDEQPGGALAARSLRMEFSQSPV